VPAIIAPFHRYAPPDTAFVIKAGFLACAYNFRLSGMFQWPLKILVAYSCGGSYGMGKITAPYSLLSGRTRITLIRL